MLRCRKPMYRAVTCLLYTKGIYNIYLDIAYPKTNAMIRLIRECAIRCKCRRTYH